MNKHMKLDRKVICFLGLHSWTWWLYRGAWIDNFDLSNKFVYQERYCRFCFKMESKIVKVKNVYEKKPIHFRNYN
jgi:hypothetical protein